MSDGLTDSAQNIKTISSVKQLYCCRLFH